MNWHSIAYLLCVCIASTARSQDTWDIGLAAESVFKTYTRHQSDGLDDEEIIYLQFIGTNGEQHLMHDPRVVVRLPPNLRLIPRNTNKNRRLYPPSSFEYDEKAGIIVWEDIEQWGGSATKGPRKIGDPLPYAGSIVHLISVYGIAVGTGAVEVSLEWRDDTNTIRRFAHKLAEVTIVADESPPPTPPLGTPDFSISGTQIGPGRYRFNFSEEGETEHKVYYRWRIPISQEYGGWTKVDDGGEVAGLPDGTYTLEAQAHFVKGEWSKIVTATLRIQSDKGPYLDFIPPDTKNPGRVEIHFTYRDPGNLTFKGLRYKVDDKPDWFPSEEFSSLNPIVIMGMTPGKHRLHVQAANIAAYTRDISYEFDVKPIPEGAFVVAKLDTNSPARRPVFFVIADESKNRSVPFLYRYLVHSSATEGDSYWSGWREYHEGRRFTLIGLPPGTYGLYVQAQDNNHKEGQVYMLKGGFTIPPPRPLWSLNLTRSETLVTRDLGERFRTGWTYQFDAYLEAFSRLAFGLSTSYLDFSGKPQGKPSDLQVVAASALARYRLARTERLFVYGYAGFGVRRFDFDVEIPNYSDATRSGFLVGANAEYLLKSLDDGLNVSLVLRTGVDFSPGGKDFSALMWTPPVAFGVNCTWAR